MPKTFSEIMTIYKSAGVVSFSYDDFMEKILHTVKYVESNIPGGLYAIVNTNPSRTGYTTPVILPTDGVTYKGDAIKKQPPQSL